MAEFNHSPRVRDTVFDVSAERLARVYAEAAFAAAGGAAEQDSLMAELESLRDDVLNRNPRLQELGLYPLSKGNTIKRELWEFLEFVTSPFQEAARELKLGTPVRHQ